MVPVYYMLHLASGVVLQVSRPSLFQTIYNRFTVYTSLTSGFNHDIMTCVHPLI